MVDVRMNGKHNRTCVERNVWQIDLYDIFSIYISDIATY